MFKQYVKDKILLEFSYKYKDDSKTHAPINKKNVEEFHTKQPMNSRGRAGQI